MENVEQTETLTEKIMVEMEEIFIGDIPRFNFEAMLRLYKKYFLSLGDGQRLSNTHRREGVIKNQVNVVSFWYALMNVINNRNFDTKYYSSTDDLKDEQDMFFLTCAKIHAKYHNRISDDRMYDFAVKTMHDYFMVGLIHTTDTYYSDCGLNFCLFFTNEPVVGKLAFYAESPKSGLKCGFITSVTNKDVTILMHYNSLCSLKMTVFYHSVYKFMLLCEIPNGRQAVPKVFSRRSNDFKKHLQFTILDFNDLADIRKCLG